MDDIPQLPATGKTGDDTANPAADLIRKKIAGLYQKEPDYKDEIFTATDKSLGSKRSKHQQFIYELTTANKSMVEIQTAWHDYYSRLSDREKHEVWQEFYSAHAHAAKSMRSASMVAPGTAHAPSSQPAAAVTHTQHRRKAASRFAQVENVRRQLVKDNPLAQKLGQNRQLRSLFFGLSMGALVILFLLFGLFNERFIAPFITPSRSVTNTPIISDSTAAVGPEPKIVIPKINVEIPVVFDEPSVDERAVQTALERGVVHYANTASPGQNGNIVIVGHSSNNIFNKGKYKFAFVLLSKLDTNDTFSLQKDGRRYTYRIYEKKIIKPTDLSVLQAQARPASATLITCDPPGTSVNRLVVIAEQISPDPIANSAGPPGSAVASTQPKIIPGNAPSIWERLFGN